MALHSRILYHGAKVPGKETERLPTVRSIPGPCRLLFYSFDCNEPPHVHVQRENRVCKFWLDPLTLAANHGVSPRELKDIVRVVRMNAGRNNTRGMG
ncbi:MAG: DUF4160 domain-containing protein [Thermodesulfobacteriota bacterium]